MAKFKSSNWIYDVYLSNWDFGEYIEMEVYNKKSANKAGKHLKHLNNTSMLSIA